MPETKLDKVERQVRELLKFQEKIERREEIKRILKDQDKGVLPYIVEIAKYLSAIIVVLVAKDQALKYKWITDLLGS